MLNDQLNGREPHTIKISLLSLSITDIWLLELSCILRNCSAPHALHIIVRRLAHSTTNTATVSCLHLR